MQKIKFDFEATKERIYAPNSDVPIGAPVDRNGNIANDGNAYGIVLCKETENEKYWVKYNLVVMVAGYCDIIDAQAIWGDEYSAEAIAAMSDIVFCDNHKIGGGGNDEPDLEFQIEIPWEREDYSEPSYLFNGDDLTVISGGFDAIREKINNEQECNIIAHFKYHYGDYVNLTKTSVVSTQNYNGDIWLGFYMPGTAYEYHYFVNTCIHADNTVDGEVRKCK